MSEEATPTPQASEESQSPPATNGGNGPQKSKKAKPQKPLPTDRLTFNKQIDTLRGIVAASNSGSKPVRLNDIAEVVKMHPNTVTLITPFFKDIGLIQKTEAGYIPTTEVINWVSACEWNPQTAGQKLAPIIAASWFAQALMPKLSFRAMDEREAIEDLATTAAVGTEYTTPVRILLNYMETAGLIVREGTKITKASQAPSAQPERPSATVSVEQKEPLIVTAKAPTQHYYGGGLAMAEGAVQFQINVRVNMSEISTWKPERIAAFFNGLAQVLAAQGGNDSDES